MALTAALAPNCFGEKEGNTVAMRTKMMADPVRYPRMTTQEMRDTFLIDGLHQAGNLQLNYVDLDRAVVGMATPFDAPLVLPSTPELRAAFFTERREVGALNVGGPGVIHVGAASYALDNLDQIGRASCRERV